VNKMATYHQRRQQQQPFDDNASIEDLRYLANPNVFIDSDKLDQIVRRVRVAEPPPQHQQQPQQPPRPPPPPPPAYVGQQRGNKYPQSVSSYSTYQQQQQRAPPASYHPQQHHRVPPHHISVGGDESIYTDDQDDGSLPLPPPPPPGRRPQIDRELVSNVVEQVMANQDKRKAYDTYYENDMNEQMAETAGHFSETPTPRYIEGRYDGNRAKQLELTRRVMTLQEKQVVKNVTTILEVLAKMGETAADVADFHLIETKDLSTAVKQATDNNEFDISIHHWLREGNGEILKNPYLSLLTTISAVVLQNHSRIVQEKLRTGNVKPLKYDREKTLEKKRREREKRLRKEEERDKRYAMRAQEEARNQEDIREKIKTELMAELRTSITEEMRQELRRSVLGQQQMPIQQQHSPAHSTTSSLNYSSTSSSVSSRQQHSRRKKQKPLVVESHPIVHVDIESPKHVVIEKPIAVAEKPAVAEKAAEKPVVAEKAAEKPVVAEKAAEKPVVAEKAVEKPMVVEKVLEKPVVVVEKKPIVTVEKKSEKKEKKIVIELDDDDDDDDDDNMSDTTVLRSEDDNDDASDDTDVEVVEKRRIEFPTMNPVAKQGVEMFEKTIAPVVETFLQGEAEKEELKQEYEDTEAKLKQFNHSIFF